MHVPKHPGLHRGLGRERRGNVPGNMGIRHGCGRGRWALVCALLGVSLASGSASASAWSTASKVVPGGLAVVISVDLVAVKKSPLGPMLRELLKKPFGEVLSEVPAKCGTDPYERLSSMVIALDEQGDGAVFVELRGGSMDEAVSCLRKVITHSDVSVRTTDTRIEIEEDGRTELAIGWRGNTAIIPLHHMRVEGEERGGATLDRMTKGGGVAKDAILIRGLRDLDTSAAIWGIVGERQDWTGDSFRNPRSSSRARSERTLVAQDAPVEPAGDDKVVFPRDDEDRRATMLYAVGQLTLGGSSRLTVKGYFKADADWVKSGVERIAHKDLEEVLGPRAGAIEVSVSGPRVTATLGLDDRALGDIVSKLVN